MMQLQEERFSGFLRARLLEPSRTYLILARASERERERECLSYTFLLHQVTVVFMINFHTERLPQFFLIVVGQIILFLIVH